MDIRKYLSKPPSKSKKPRPAPAPAPTTPTRTSPRRRKIQQPEEDEEDFQPRRKRTSKSSEKPKQTTPASTPASTPAPKPMKRPPPPDTGFGGASTEEPVKKKPRWVPRSDDPPNRGNKPLPVGAPNCLVGKVFVITGVLDSLLREECTDLCKEYGARVVGSVSKKVTHGIVGTEPGASKIAKLKQNGAPLISEDDLFDMINCTNKGAKREIKVDVTDVKEENVDDDDDVIMAEEKPVKKGKASPAKAGGKKADGKKGKPLPPNTAALWVDKYKPANSSELVANPKAIKDLRNWLINWKSKFLYGKGHSWKQRERGDQDWPAALIVGAPGIGKTTAAHIVCREAGFEPHEFNASDVRNKGGVLMLAETVMVANTMSKYLKVRTGAGDDAGKPTSYPEGQVLIMDEVDGMSGGDRGGSQELLRMIKKSKVPVICIANDDSSANMRSLSGNCFKLRFRRPMVSQVTKRLTSIAMREGFRSMQDQTLAKLAEGCNGDVRQMINLLQTWRCSSANLSYSDVRSRLEMEGKTVIQKSVFELAKSFFSPGVDGSNNSLMARTDNYFSDADLMPLFVQENYINTAAAESLEALADAAESISEGDLCSTVIRSEQRWDLMPAAAILSAIRPGSILAGGLGSQPMFPSFLGNISKGNKWKRIVTGLEMKIRAVKTSSGSPRNFRLDYVPAMTTCLATPLIRSGAAGIAEVVDRLDSYFLERDPDWLEILEAGVYTKGRGPLENIKGPVKASFTREYNSRGHGRSSVTGMRVGVKGGDSDFSKKVANGGEDVAVVDDDLDLVEESEEESDVDVVKEFGAKKKKGKKATPKKATPKKATPKKTTPKKTTPKKTTPKKAAPKKAAGGRGRGGGRGSRGRGRGRGRKS